MKTHWKYNWKILLGIQFAVWAWLAMFLSPFPQAGIIFQSITFLLNKRLALVELVCEFPFNLIARQFILILVSSLWSIEANIIAKLMATVLIISLYLALNVLVGFGLVGLVSRFVKRSLKKHSPDLWTMMHA